MHLLLPIARQNSVRLLENILEGTSRLRKSHFVLYINQSTVPTQHEVIRDRQGFLVAFAARYPGSADAGRKLFIEKKVNNIAGSNGGHFHR